MTLLEVVKMDEKLKEGLVSNLRKTKGFNVIKKIKKKVRDFQNKCTDLEFYYIFAKKKIYILFSFCFKKSGLAQINL